MSSRTFILGLLLMLASVCLVQAQQGPPPGEGGRGGGPSVEDRLERLTDELELTDDQVAKIKPILEETKEQMEALRESGSSDREAQMEQMKKLMDSEEEQISALLTEAQKTKLAELKKEREKNRPSRGQGGGGRPQR